MTSALIMHAAEEAIAKRRSVLSASPGSTPAAQKPAHAGLFARIRARFDPEWDPHKHPRDLNGRFTRAAAGAMLVTAAVSGITATVQSVPHEPVGHQGTQQVLVEPTGHHPQGLPNAPHAPGDKPDPKEHHHDDEPVNPNIRPNRLFIQRYGSDPQAVGELLPPEQLDRMRVILERGKDGAPLKIARVIQYQLETIHEAQGKATAKEPAESDVGVSPGHAPKPGKVSLGPFLSSTPRRV